MDDAFRRIEPRRLESDRGANWSLDGSDGSVMADMGAEGHLVTESSFGDFELVIEFWAEPATNSGVYIRCSDPLDITAQKCYEVNISDMRADPTYRTGAVVGVSSPLEQVDAGDRWNEYVIRAEGPRLTVTLNGVRDRGRGGRYALGRGHRASVFDGAHQVSERPDPSPLTSGVVSTSSS